MDTKGVCYDVGRAYSGYFLTPQPQDNVSMCMHLGSGQ